MTSDASMDAVLPGFIHQFNKHWSADQDVLVAGFSKPSFRLPKNFGFYSIGDFGQYPADRWSDALKKVIDNVAEDVFMLLLDDYWLVRDVDRLGVTIMADYMRQFTNVIKFDATRDRLYSDPGRYFYDYNTYGSAGHLDIIKSPAGTPYHLSLWGGLWRGEHMLKVLIPNETAQQIELEGTRRLSAFGDDLLVLGTRQGPVFHGNILQSSKEGPVFQDGGWKINNMGELEENGLLDKLKELA